VPDVDLLTSATRVFVEALIGASMRIAHRSRDGAAAPRAGQRTPQHQPTQNTVPNTCRLI
jgi:hypothetical protein